MTLDTLTKIHLSSAGYLPESHVIGRDNAYTVAHRGLALFEREQ